MAAITIVGFGGRAKRENGWRFVVGAMTVSAVTEILTMSMIAHEFQTNDLFFYGCRLGESYPSYHLLCFVRTYH